MTELSFQLTQRQFAAHLRDPETVSPPPDIEPRRLKIYLDLFYNNIENFLRNGFPVLRSLLDDTRWHALVRAFFRGHACASPYFIEIPREFVEFLADGSAPAADYPPFMVELAHYEYMELALEVAREELPRMGVNPEGDLMSAAPFLSPLMCVLSYRWPVHHIAADFIPEEPLVDPVFLVVYRDPEDRVCFLEINAITAGLLQKIEASPRQPGRQILADLARDLGLGQEQTLQFGAQALEQLRARHILLGTSLETV